MMFVSACATKPLTSVDRIRYPLVAVNNRVECPKQYSYVDITAQRARGAGAGFGLVGALVGEAVASGSISSGRDRFDKVVQKVPVDIKSGLWQSFTTTLTSAKLFQVVPVGRGEKATFNIEVLAYGLQPANDRQLGGVITLRADLVDGAKNALWSKTATGTSSVSAFLDDYEKNPLLWKQVMEEALADVTRKAILYAE